MQFDDSHNQETLGADLRAMRKSRGFTLECLSEKLGRSTGWVSQVERAISIPTNEDLKAFSAILDAPLSMLLPENPEISEEAGYIVRKDARRKLERHVEGLDEELISPDLTDDFEAVYSTFASGSKSAECVQRPTQELGILIEGKLDLTISNRSFQINAGDSFRVRGEPFSWANPYETPAIAIWVIAPPVY